MGKPFLNTKSSIVSKENQSLRIFRHTIDNTKNPDLKFVISNDSRNYLQRREVRGCTSKKLPEKLTNLLYRRFEAFSGVNNCYSL